MEVTVEQVVAAIQSIVLKKAPGPGNLYPEDFFHSPIGLLANLLAPLFQAMISIHYVPPSFTLFHVIPIPKSRTADLSNPSNYRGISISSVLQTV